nr:uncharacterized protein LOC106679401 isoform X2 [Halyomorpha halys]
MSEVLIYFHMFYSELKPPLESSTFLYKMSDLMALYVDLEIEASRSGTESLQDIASKITSCLFIYFGCSHVHILDTILKTKKINRDSWELSDLIFRRVLRDPPGLSINVTTYMRYILAFKLWIEIMGSAEERKRIQLMAEYHLIPPPEFEEKLSWNSLLRDIFPRIPESEMNITHFLLEYNFMLRDKIEMFSKAVAGPKLQSTVDHQNSASTNYSYIPHEKDNDEHDCSMDYGDNMNQESDIKDSLLLDENDDCPDKNKKLCQLKHDVRSVSKNELKMKWNKDELSLEGIGKDENSFNAVEFEDIVKKDQSFQVDSVWEGDAMDVAAEVELLSSPLDIIDSPTIEPEPQPSHSKETVVYSWDTSTTHSYLSCNDCDSKSEFIVENNPKQAAIFDVQNKNQAFETCLSIEDKYSAQRSDLTHSEQVLTDSKSSDVSRTQNILNEEYFPLTPINNTFEEHNSGILCEEQNEEMSSAKHNEELPLEEFNQDIHLGEPNEGRHSTECISGRTVELINSERHSEQSEETPPEIRGLVHDFTLENDNKIYKFHLKLSSYWEKLNKHTWISLLFPLFSEQNIKTPRCACFRCTQNYDIIMKNWNSAITNLSRLPGNFSDSGIFSGNFDNSVLKEMKELLQTDGLKLLVWEPEMDEVFTKIEKLINEKTKHLPLKKRKAFSFNTDVNNKKNEISYPSTPMISIAELELAKEKFRFNAMNMNMNHPSTCIASPPPLNYIPDYLSHSDHPNPADFKCDIAVVQPNITSISSDQDAVPGAFTTTIISEHQEQNRPKFKTPAQLKDFQHLSAAEDLINFSLTSRTYYNENQEPRIEKRWTKQKTKSPRKRKRII